MMNILLIFPGFIIAFIIILCYEHKIKNLSVKPKNKVHFYVARDKDGKLWLYLGKPERRHCSFLNSNGAIGSFMANEYHFIDFGLTPDDFKDLKWEDEPVEVFLNLED